MNRLHLVPDGSIQLLGLVKAVMILLLTAVQEIALQNGPFLPHTAMRVVLVAGPMPYALHSTDDRTGFGRNESWCNLDIREFQWQA